MSSASKLFAKHELNELLVKSQVNNARRGVTGMLLYSDGSIVQVIEGEEHKVKELYSIISDDERHKNILKISGGPLATRNFADWSMGYRSVTSDEMSRFNSYVNPLNQGDFLGDKDAHPAITILKTFVSTNLMYF
jgi:acylphosphatase